MKIKRNIYKIESAVDILDVPESNRHGNCFEVALKEFLKNPKRYTLVHGVVVGQGPLDGLEYCHAWVIDERTDTVIDKTQPQGKQKFPIGLYYMIGKIEITKEYDLESVYEMVDKYGTYGPWDSVFNNYP